MVYVHAEYELCCCETIPAKQRPSPQQIRQQKAEPRQAACGCAVSVALCPQLHDQQLTSWQQLLPVTTPAGCLSADGHPELAATHHG